MKWDVLIDKLIWLFTLVLFCSFYVFNATEYSRFILLGITFAVVGLLLLKNSGRIPLYWHSFHSTVCLFAFFCFLSCTWSIVPTETLVKTTTILQIWICMSVLYTHFVQQRDITPLLDIIMWSGYILTFYAFQFYGIGVIKSVIASAGRLDNAFSNVNTIGMLAALSTVITAYKILFYKFKWYHFLVLANIFMIAACGSRKSLVLFVLGMGAVVFLRYSAKNWVVSAVRYILVGVVLLLLFKLLLTLPMFAGVNQRMETLFNMYSGHGNVDNSAILRNMMVHAGWQQFLQTPFMGTGIGSSGELLLPIAGWRTYFHNNYIELLATGGIVGTFLYYLMFLIPALKLWKQRTLGDKNTYLCLIMIGLLLIMDWGAVSYYSKNTYFYIMLFFIQVQMNTRCLKEKINGQTTQSI